ncbi:hypothetical protein M3Y96_00930600 [Aphelenchoides besseyi]|nr:hypothetical protein M3Y96_00930600 [Aphelenchoides besseyi]
MPRSQGGSRYELTKFVNVSLCNIYSMHVFKPHDKKNQVTDKLHVIMTDICGTLSFIVGNVKKVRRDLREMLCEQLIDDLSLELVGSYMHQYGCEEGPTFAYIGTMYDNSAVINYPNNLDGFSTINCLDRLVSLPLSMQLTKISQSNCVIREQVQFFDLPLLGCKFKLAFPPTYTQLRVKDNRLVWMVCGTPGKSIAFEALTKDPNLSIADRIQPVEQMHSVFSGFLFTKKFRAPIQFSEITVDNFHFTVFGFDSGFLVATVENQEGVIDRKCLKFNTAISVVKLLESVPDQGVFTLISSTIGPAAVWTLKLDLEEMELKWHMRSLLLDSENHDTIMCAAVACETIMIGTYDEQIIFYSLRDTFNYADVLPLSSLNVGAPILQIEPIDEKLLILSAKGLQQYDLIVPEDEETLDDPSSSSSPKSVSLLTLND